MLSDKAQVCDICGGEIPAGEQLSYAGGDVMHPTCYALDQISELRKLIWDLDEQLSIMRRQQETLIELLGVPDER